jgi:hypothetical protein
VKKMLGLALLTNFLISANITEKTQKMEKMPGYINMYWDEAEGKVFLEISKLDDELLYVNSLTGGLGSNDIGLDRGQLGSKGRVVYFHKVGKKILLIESNYGFRASTKDPMEKRAVQDAFAQSAIWGFKVIAEQRSKYLIDATDFILRDSHGVVDRLRSRKMGNFKIDKSRSVLYKNGTMNFRNNTELESMVTFTGSGAGQYVRQVSPNPKALTLRMHHSFIKLPDDNYQPRKHDPRSGYFPMSYQDYAVPLDDSIHKYFITRHRLKKKNPNAVKSDVVKPIVYYIDPGVPEPVKTAMIESGMWWNQAFEAIGYENAFQVKILPKGAHPMDVRYNMIHWVHRATRGWSYGGAVIDPRTGEIIKGNVSLGSLRLRQDYLIATGLMAPYKNENTVPSAMRELALARIRQLVAHEIGHTIGIQHNFLASTFGRASVMDYPHPTLNLNSNNELEWENAYDVGIGEWDKLAVEFGYQHFPEGTDEKQALDKILQKGIKSGITFITDSDARPIGSAHPGSHLWDNGSDPIDELENLINIRDVSLQRFGENNIRYGQPYSDLGDVLVPIYFLHRYQIEAAGKIVGGLNYTYALRGDGQMISQMLEPEEQLRSLKTLIKTLQPDFLTLDERILNLIPPRAAGRGRTRESFRSKTGLTFDGVSLAETAVDMSCKMLFNHERAARLVEYNARDDKQPGLDKVLSLILENTLLSKAPKGLKGEVKRASDFVILDHLLNLAVNPDAATSVQSITMLQVKTLSSSLLRSNPKDPRERGHKDMLSERIESFFDNPYTFKKIIVPKAPPGSPIGSNIQCSQDDLN